MIRDNERGMLYPDGRRSLCRLVMLVVAALISIPESGHGANGLEDENGEAPETRRARSLSAVVVTANKLNQSPVEVPASISAIHREDLEQDGVRDVRDIVGMTPGLTFQPIGQSGLNPPVMRGLTANIISFSSSTLLSVDGVPMLRAQGFDADMTGVDQVEVLRGPQSTLYGRNAQAGVINVTTRRQGNDPYAQVVLEGGGRRMAAVRADLGRAIVRDRLYLSLDGSFARQDGFISNLYTGRKDDGRRKHSGRLSLRATPAAGTDIALRVATANHDDGASLWGSPAAPRVTVQSGYEGRNTSHGRTVSLDVKHELTSGVRLRSISAYNVWKDRLLQDTDYLIPDRLHADRNHEFRTLSQEFRMEGRAGEGSWLAGLYGDREDNHLEFVQKTPLATVPTNAGEKSHSLALYTHWNVPFSASWSLAAGARIERMHTRFAFRDSGRLEKNHTRFSPKLALSYALDESNRVWSSVSEGYRSGGFNAFAPERWREYEPERVRSLEVGVKGELKELSGMRYSFSVYQMNVHDMQVQQMGQPGQVFISNAARAKSRGAEFEMEYMMFSDWMLQLGLSMNHTRFDEFRDGDVNHAGKHNPMAPDRSGYVGVRYDGGSWYAGARLNGASRVWLDAANVYPRTGYGLIDMTAGWRMNRNVDVGVFVRNLGDKDYDAIGFQNGSTVIYGIPREFGFRMTWRL